MGRMKEAWAAQFEHEEVDPREFEQIFAARLRRERLRRGWRQEDLARELERHGVTLHPSAIAKIERAPEPDRGITPRAVRLAEAVVIARVFGMTVEAMLRDDDLSDTRKLILQLEQSVERLKTGIEENRNGFEVMSRNLAAAEAELARLYDQQAHEAAAQFGVQLGDHPHSFHGDEQAVIGTADEPVTSGNADDGHAMDTPSDGGDPR